MTNIKAPRLGPNSEEVLLEDSVSAQMKRTGYRTLRSKKHGWTWIFSNHIFQTGSRTENERLQFLISRRIFFSDEKFYGFNFFIKSIYFDRILEW